VKERDVISCEQALSLVYEFLDGELDGVPEEQVRAHFDMCRECYPHLKLEASFRAALRKASLGEAPPAELKQRLMEELSRVEDGLA
jgi:anti-sigma factor (TIGR02949 family)